VADPMITKLRAASALAASLADDAEQGLVDHYEVDRRLVAIAIELSGARRVLENRRG
jgi:hypothetical protein